MRRIILWFTLLNKRLLKRISFLVILCCIPVLVAGVHFMTKQDSGMLHVVLCREEKDDALVDEVVRGLKEHENMLHLIETDSEKEAKHLVQSGKADVAWIFPEDLQEAIEEYLADDVREEGIITVVEKEDNVALRLSREILFGRIYPAVSYGLYTQFVQEELTQEGSVSGEVLLEHYDKTNIEGNLFDFHFLDGSKGDVDTSYLLFPMRGILALIIALCGLTFSLYLMQDEEKGVFTWLPLNKSVVGSLLYQLPGLLDMGAIVLVALILAGMFTNWWTELALMLLYLLMIAGFADVVRRLCGKPVHLAALIPVLMLLMLALSPIFMGAVNARPIQILLPPYYYLNAIHNQSYRMWMLVYIVVVYGLDIIISKITAKRCLK